MIIFKTDAITNLTSEDMQKHTHTLTPKPIGRKQHVRTCKCSENNTVVRVLIIFLSSYSPDYHYSSDVPTGWKKKYMCAKTAVLKFMVLNYSETMKICR